MRWPDSHIRELTSTQGARMPSSEFTHDVVVIGGGGHVGLPLAIALAEQGASVVVYDVSHEAVKMLNDAVLPFEEPGAGAILERVVDEGRLIATTDPAVVSCAENVVVVIGTPVDEHLNPDPTPSRGRSQACIRSPLRRPAPGPAQHGLPRRDGPRRAAASPASARMSTSSFCPERIAEGQAMNELLRAAADRGQPRPTGRADRAAALFARLTERTRLRRRPRRPS